MAYYLRSKCLNWVPRSLCKIVFKPSHTLSLLKYNNIYTQNSANLFTSSNTQDISTELDKSNNLDNTSDTMEYLKEKIIILENDITENVKKTKETQDKFLRTLADLENLRQRHQKDLENTRIYAISNFAKSLLEVIDNLSRALSAFPSDKIQSDKNLKSIYDGIDLTNSTLLKIFENFGIYKFECIGEIFDPKKHEVLFETIDDNKPKGTISCELLPGYTIHDRILRPAKVVTVKHS
ncbi:GrpE family protein, putative [Cryptosporidium muris RN66]|uniref:GrpE protein homolog n=1 Tax=Cryptosporidium muris (strain RN66) TaxID=441375 RepID=B6ACF7_CRYMR|nr:GrpE family protein, putative [Cryptosporidium muris RN66]EEA05811.1 GrpE family protein, putative [Cryptosporidium muris RN66]|eukprot:XP_002140160.1 GrpE family protein [Cryptosporidium muris RN66]